jgi:hypothetical protein
MRNDTKEKGPYLERQDLVSDPVVCNGFTVDDEGLRIRPNVPINSRAKLQNFLNKTVRTMHSV